MDKISVIEHIDPYCSQNLSESVLPPIEPADILSYLVLGTSAYTSDQFKAYRSLDAYNQCFRGWVKEVAGFTVGQKYVVVGKVRP